MLSGLPVPALAQRPGQAEPTPGELLERYQAGPLVPDKLIFPGESSVPRWLLLWEEARQAVRAGQFAEAVTRYHTLLDLKPGLEEGRWELARLLGRRQEWNEAGRHLELLIERNPTRVDYLFTFAYVNWLLEHPDRAAHLFDKIVESLPDNREALAGAVRCFLLAGQEDKALADLERLNHLDPADSTVRGHLARIYVNRGLDDKARPHLVALAKGPMVDPELLVMTARVHERLGLDNLAGVYWRKVLDRLPEDGEARRYLARLYDNDGRYAEALAVLMPLLESSPADRELLRDAGRLSIKAGREAEGVALLERYLLVEPHDKEVVRQLVRIYARHGDKERIVNVLEGYFPLQAKAPAVQLKHAARDYDDTGHLREAVSLYRRLLTIAPDDSEILATLGDDLLSIGENDGTLAMRKHLKQLGPKRVELYRSMAELLEGMGRDAELVEVLETIHDLEPADGKVTLKLANIYLAQGDLTRSLYFFEWLAQAGCRDIRFYEGRGTLFERLNKPSSALAAFEQLLQVAPERQDVRLRCVRLAGRLGVIESVRDNLQKIAAYSGGGQEVETMLVGAAALRDCGAHGEAQAVYRRLLAETRDDNRELRARILLEQASTYQAAGLPFESEQCLRVALLLTPDSSPVLDRLFAHAVHEKNSVEEADRWLTMRSSRRDVTAAVDDCLLADPSWEASRQADWQISLHRIGVLAISGERRKAIGRAEALLDEIGRQPAWQDKAWMRELWQRVALDLAGLLLENDDPEAARAICLEILKYSRAAGSDQPLPLVLLMKSYRQQEQMAEARQVFTRLLNAARQDLGRMLETTRVLQRNGLNAEMLYLAREACQLEPRSDQAVYLLVEALVANHDNQEAMGVLETLIATRPDSDRARMMRLGLLFDLGRYEQVLADSETLCATAAPCRPEVLMLRARALWAAGRWRDSLAIYESFLTPDVDHLFVEELAQHGLTVQFPRHERTFGELVTFAREKLPDPLALVLDVDGSKTGTTTSDTRQRLAAKYLALYRWQGLFAREYAARRSLQRREYFQAMHEFRGLVRDYPADEALLFDLAGVYSRLGRLQDEALLYEKLTELDADYPGLAKARERNQLKRQPRFTVGYGYQRAEGYAGYQALKKQWWQATMWASPRPQHEVELSVTRPSCQSTDSGAGVDSRRAELTYRAHFLNGLSVEIGSGLEDLEDGYAGTGLLNGSVEGVLGDALTGYIAFDRDLVTDTTASLTRNVVAHGMTSGLALDLLPRLQVGGDYGVSNFSDNNYTQGYDLWTSYIIFQEPYALSFSYSYTFKESKEGASPSPAMADGFGPDDHPYWAPRNYWKNRFTLVFKHQLSDDTLGRGVPRYYSVRYCVDYDSFGYGGQELGGSLFVELSPRFILEADIDYTSSQLARSREIFLAVDYRW